MGKSSDVCKLRLLGPGDSTLTKQTREGMNLALNTASQPKSQVTLGRLHDFHFLTWRMPLLGGSKGSV